MRPVVARRRSLGIGLASAPAMRAAAPGFSAKRCLPTSLRMISRDVLPSLRPSPRTVSGPETGPPRGPNSGRWQTLRPVAVSPFCRTWGVNLAASLSERPPAAAPARDVLSKSAPFRDKAPPRNVEVICGLEAYSSSQQKTPREGDSESPEKRHLRAKNREIEVRKRHRF